MNIRKVAVSRSQVEAEDTPLSALSEPSPTPHFPAKQTRRKSLDKAQKIMEVALDLFSGSHFGSITIKDIARETGFNSALLYYYFESKDENRLRWLGNGWSVTQIGDGGDPAWYLEPGLVNVPVKGRPEEDEEFKLRPFSH